VSYDIYLRDPENHVVLKLDYKHCMGGGTQVLGGTDELWLNVTYNYSTHYYRVFGDKGIRTIYGKTGAESVPILEDAISKLGDKRSLDYWKPTEGNAKAALIYLLAFANLRPDGVWDGD
jgi:hypothetical protein